jgi:hypothetical protein
MARVWLAPSVVEVTDAADGLSHRVPQRLYEEGLARSAGRFPATCGRTVLAAPLVSRPGPGCPLCWAAVGRGRT